MEKNPYAVALGALGGKKRAERMTPEARKEHARKMNEAKQKRRLESQSENPNHGLDSDSVSGNEKPN